MLKELRASSNKYKQMIQILEDIETLKGVPDKLEQQISQKYFMSAHSTLSAALQTAEKENLQNLATLKAIKSYLVSQEAALFSTLIKELHNHIYLKSPYCDSRWRTYRQGAEEFGNAEQMLEDKIRFDLSEKSSSFSETSLLDAFLASANQEFFEEQDENAEENSFYYIRLLIETLGNLNQLPNTFDIVSQSLSSELHTIIDKTIAEVSHRFPKSLNVTPSKSPYAMFEVGLGAGENRLAALKDLTWTLYSKFIAILQAHRVIYEVGQGIYARHGKQDKSGLPPYDFAGAYAAIEAEVKALLNSYVTGDDTAPTTSLNQQSVKLKLNKGAGILEKNPRDKKKAIFKFSNVDISQEDLKEQHEILKQAFEKSVPGLVSSAGNDDYQDSFDPYLPLESTSTHQILVPPNFFNIRVMLEPTVQFLQKATTIFPAKVPKPNDDLIETFLVTVCAPQLELALNGVYEAIMNGSSRGADIFEYSTRWNKVSKLPILQAMIAFTEMITRTCSLLGTSNLYRQHYVTIILNLIRKFVTFTREHYESKVVYQESSDERSAGYSSAPSKLTTKRKLAASWVLNEQTRQFLNSTSPYEYDAAYSSTSTDPPYKQEFEFYHSRRAAQKTKNTTPINESDLLSFSMFQGIAALATSLRWLSVKLRRLRRVSEAEKGEKGSDDLGAGNNITTKLRKRWVLLEEFKSSENDAKNANEASLDDVGLTLSGESIAEFDKEVEAIDHLSETCVLTLKADLRCRTIYYIDKAMKQGQYYLAADTEERDPNIGKLDSEIMKCDAISTESLVSDDMSMVVAGLAKFIDELLITSADGLVYINDFGVKKMNRNIQVLQQMLKSIAESPQSVDFSRSLAFYDLMKITSHALLEQAKQRETSFSHDELKTILRLIRNKAVRRHELSGRRDLMQTEKNALHDDLVKLHDCYWGSEKVEM